MTILKSIFQIVTLLEVQADFLWLLNGDWRWYLLSEGEESPATLSISVDRYMEHHYDLDIFSVQPGPAVLLSQNALLSANEDWTEACVTLLDGKEDGLEGAIIAAIMTHLSTRGGLMLHTSLVDYQGKGILFVGPSGIGKTTQAELWMKYRDAIIINGDMALVGEKDGSFTGYGCPWHGSSPYCENRQVPLAGIIVLEQAKENTLERLHGVTMIERMMRNIFLPHWYQKGAEAAMETVDHLLSTVPVYLLKCRPDEEAVAMVERALFESND